MDSNYGARESLSLIYSGTERRVPAGGYLLGVGGPHGHKNPGVPLGTLELVVRATRWATALVYTRARPAQASPAPGARGRSRGSLSEGRATVWRLSRGWPGRRQLRGRWSLPALRRSVPNSESRARPNLRRILHPGARLVSLRVTRALPASLSRPQSSGPPYPAALGR